MELQLELGLELQFELGLELQLELGELRQLTGLPALVLARARSRHRMGTGQVAPDP